MQVLDHQHCRGSFRQTVQQAEKSLEQPGLRQRADDPRAGRRLRYVVGRPELRQHAGQEGSVRPDEIGQHGRIETPAEAAKRLDHRAVRQRSLA